MNVTRLAGSLILGITVAACGSTPSPTATPATTAVASAPASPQPSPTTPSATAGPSPVVADGLLGKVVVTASDNLVVRSEPRVGDDSIMYSPWLPLGTRLTVLDGPVDASGYTWYKVAPVSFGGLDGPGYGWVAMAAKDGSPWIGLAPNASGPPADDLLQASTSRATADPRAGRTAAASITAFGLDLYRAILADPKLAVGGSNVVFSPTSVALALGMARAGARGATASQLDAVLHTSGWAALGPGLNALDQALASRNLSWTDFDGAAHSLALHIANAAYGQRGWAIERPYLEAIAATFGAGLRLADFAADPDAARQAINSWVSDQTAGRIPSLLAVPDVTGLTRLVLVNAIYLKAEWEWPFELRATRPAPFVRLDGSRVTVPTMFQVGAGAPGRRPIPYASGPGWQAVELRYKGSDSTDPLAMTLVLPADLAAFEASLTASQLSRITTALAGQREAFATGVPCPGVPSGDGPGCYPYDLRLYLPRFTVGTHAPLNDELAKLGMSLAFDQQRSDFGGIHVPRDANDRLYIRKVVHQANIAVDEKGTEAAAATAVLGETGGGPSAAKTITVRLDHPFLFFVRDIATGAVLFMGRVTDPSQKGG